MTVEDQDAEGPTWNQTTRLIRFATPKAPTELIAVRFESEERLGQPFRHRVDVFAEDFALEPQALLGEPGLLTISQSADREADFHGHIIDVTALGHDPSLRRDAFRLTLAPFTTFLARRRDCRIYQDRDVQTIITEVFGYFQFQDRIRFDLSGPTPTLPYCVQYNESYWNFVQRLIETYGLFYFFEHTPETHTLVIADAPFAIQPSALSPTLRAQSPDAALGLDQSADWREVSRLSLARVALGDFNPDTPQLDLSVGVNAAEPPAAIGDAERFVFPGGYRTTAEGDARARTLVEAVESAALRYSARANAIGLCAGVSFELTGHEIPAWNRRYAVHAIRHAASNNVEGGASASYANSFEAAPADAPIRLDATASKPVIPGVQTGFVVGPESEEIHTDAQGRVKVQFHWDRYGRMDQASSAWLRVAQSWAGAGWGAQVIPRVGMEALIAFEHGDPDRPLVIGCLPNPDNRPALDLPGQKTCSTFKSFSSPGGGGFNELRIEDAKDAEQIFVHAQRDADWRTRASHRRSVGGSDHLSVGGERRLRIGGGAHLHVREDLLSHIEGDRGATIEGDDALKVEGSVCVSADGEIVLSAARSITLKCGGGFVKIDPGGVTISGSLVRINSGGSPSSLRLTPEDPKAPAAAASGQAGDALPEPAPKTPPDLSADRTAAAQRAAFVAAANAGAPFVRFC
ncbi:MAG: type VI secretion system Vgr family protein [Maricaulaceae bacterium]